MSQPTQCLKITEKSLIFNIASEACYVYILSFQLHFSVSAMFLSNYFWLLSNISQFSQQCCSVSRQYFLFLSNNSQFFSNNFQFLSINSQFLNKIFQFISSNSQFLSEEINFFNFFFVWKFK